MSWTTEEQPQSSIQYNWMMYMRTYRDKIKKNKIIWIKKSNIVYTTPTPPTKILSPSSF